MKPARYARSGFHVPPSCLQAGDRPGWVQRAFFALFRFANSPRKNVPLRIDGAEAIRIPTGVVNKSGEQAFVQRYRAAFTGLSFATPDG
jgi:hypothetical protein